MTPQQNLSPQMDGENKKQNASSMNNTSPACVFPSRDAAGTVESRGRRSSSTSSSASVGLKTQTQQQQQPKAMNSADVYDAMEKEQEAIVNRLTKEIESLKGYHDGGSSSANRSRSQSTSSSSSISRNPSVRSNSAIIFSDYSTDEISGSGTNSGSNRPRGHSRSSFNGGHSGSNNIITGGDENLVNSLKRENDLLKKKLADLSIKLTEKDNEIERWKNLSSASNKPRKN